MSNAIVQPAAREFEFSDSDFRFLAGLANAKTGIVLPDRKKDMVYGRLVRRLRALNLTSFSDYCALLQSEKGDDEISHLINAVTTNLTSFFREGHHFSHLRSQVLPGITGNKLRIWSSAASSGMEPYSIAMTLRASIPDIDKWDAKILATDIDTNMINTGIKGEYAAADTESVPPACQPFILPSASPGKVTMSPKLKELIAFRQLNLLENWPFKGQFDAVFCRNVIIYFDRETKQKLFERMAEHIKPNGWLYIGHSENLHGVTNRFELIGRTTYRRVK